MQEQINNLQKQIVELKQMLTNVNMPIKMREIIRNEVVKEEVEYNQTTSTTTISSLGQSFTVPTPFTKVITIKWKGKEYKVPYYV